MNAYKVIMPCNICRMSGTINSIIEYLQCSCGCINEDILFEIKVILNELISNAIKHGNRQDCSKNVKISVGVSRDCFAYFIIEDEGQGYECNCNTTMCPDLDDIDNYCDIKETGRGILIVRNLSDRITFNQKGNKVVVLKKLS